jgi:hypothetical protein
MRRSVPELSSAAPGIMEHGDSFIDGRIATVGGGLADWFR